MKFKLILSSIIGAGLLSGCVATNNVRQIDFNPSTLPYQMYDGYWAMLPEQGVYNTIKFNTDGTAKLYRFQCLSDTEYQEKAHEEYRLGSNSNNTVDMYPVKVGIGAWAGLVIDHFTVRVVAITDKGNMAKMTQLIPGKAAPLKFIYARLPSAKPLCSEPKLEQKVEKAQAKFQ